MAKKTRKSDKAMGQDPFEDMEMNGLGQEAADETEAEKAAAKAKVKPKAAKKAATKKAKPKARKRTKTEAEVKPKAAKKAATKKAKPKARKRTKTEAEVKPEAEVAADAEGPVSEVIAEPDEEASHILDELMATIDEEVEEAFGPGAMADLASVEPVGAAGEEQHVIFTLAGTEYAVPITNVTEIGQPLDITPLPNVPDWVLGVANLRGDVISMVDLRTFLGMEQIGYAQDSRMLVAQARQEDMTTGLIVDQVSGIRYLPMDRIGEPPAPIEDQVAPYLHGVYEHDDHLLVVLNLDRLLLSPEMRQFEPV